MYGFAQTDQTDLKIRPGIAQNSDILFAYFLETHPVEIISCCFDGKNAQNCDTCEFTSCAIGLEPVVLIVECLSNRQM